MSCWTHVIPIDLWTLKVRFTRLSCGALCCSLWVSWNLNKSEFEKFLYHSFHILDACALKSHLSSPRLWKIEWDSAIFTWSFCEGCEFLQCENWQIAGDLWLVAEWDFSCGWPIMKHKSDRMEEGRNGTMTQTTSIVTWRESMEVSIRVNLAMCSSSIHSILCLVVDERLSGWGGLLKFITGRTWLTRLDYKGTWETKVARLRGRTFLSMAGKRLQLFLMVDTQPHRSGSS